jgi:hypothetical protein
MIFKGTNKTVEFQLLLFDPDKWELMTGFRTISEPYSIGLRLKYEHLETFTSIFISDVKKMIDWLESLLLNKLFEPKLLVLHDQLSFDFLQIDSNFNTIQIVYDGTIPAQGMGGYSGNIDDFLLKYCVECKMNNEELRGIIIELKNEFYQALESYK